MTALSPVSASPNCSSSSSARSPGRRLAEAVEPAEEHQVLPAAEDLVDGRLLAAEPDAPPHLVRDGCDVDAGDLRAAAVGAQQGGEDPHRGRLARAVRPEQPADRALRHVEVESVERSLAGVPLHQAFGPYRPPCGSFLDTLYGVQTANNTVRRKE